MDATRFKIVFDGALMPQTPLELAKQNLARLFKSDPGRIEALFSGRPVVLKRDLSDAEADKYLQALHSAGAKARKEADFSASLSLVETEDHPSPETRPAAQAEQADSSRMTCPKCGHEQPRAAECSGCGIIIEKYLSRQAELAARAGAEAAAAPTFVPAAAASAQSPYATPQSQVGEPLPEYGELNYFTVQGRIGRVRYLGWGMGLMLLAMPALAVIGGLATVSSSLGVLLVLAGVVALSVVSIFFGVQRLHDIGWSGWLLLVNLVPVVGSVFALLMLLVPGSAGANRYGPPPPPNSRGVVALAWAFLLVPIIGIAAAISLPAYQDYVTRAQMSHYSQDASPSIDEGYDSDSGDAGQSDQ
ncbi:hypothetical protein D9M71_111480 [compost metagenome]